MALNTPKRVRTLASFASSPPGSDSSGYMSSPWNTTNTTGEQIDVIDTYRPPASTNSSPSPWPDDPTSPSSSCGGSNVSTTFGSPEYIGGVSTRPPAVQQLQYGIDVRENRRGRPRSEALTTLMIEGSTSPSAIKCGYCNRVFPREKSLQAHLRTHTGERPYPCDYPGCTRAFTQSGQLKTHQRLHTGERPFICSATSCQMRFTHANRHCPDHPYDHLRRCDDFVVQNQSEQNAEIVKWLEKYRLDKEERTPTRKTPKRSKLPTTNGNGTDCNTDNIENIGTIGGELENEFPQTPNTPYKCRKGLMVELDMNLGYESSPIAISRTKINPKTIQWHPEPLSQEEDDSGDECQAPARSTFNPKKRWLTEAWQDDLAKPLEPNSFYSAVKQIEPVKQINPNEMRPTVLMVASKDKTMPLIDLHNAHTTISTTTSNNVDLRTIDPFRSPITTKIGRSTENRKWMGALALMQLATDDETDEQSVNGDDIVSNPYPIDTIITNPNSYM